jgi:hypothetical protein
MDWKYVHTLTKFTFSDHEITLLNQHVDSYLISLITGLQQQSFGFDTVTEVAKRIRGLRARFGQDKEWFIDSGGYSIIVGDIHPRDMTKCIQCYNYYLETFAEKDCDKIFSLDIPILLKYPEYNTVQYIKEQNYKSGVMSKEILDSNKSLYEKFMFIWQFKTLNQYKIWKEYYNDIYADTTELHNFGIGGQVGLRQAAGIDFSPFTALTYKLIQLIREKNLNKKSTIHMLGIYSYPDRFLMAFFQKLFNQVYFKDLAPSVEITFDTVHHTIQGHFRGQTMTPFILDENNNVHNKFIPDLVDKLDNIIHDPDVLNAVLKQVEKIKNGERLTDPHLIATLEVIKHSQIDKVIDMVLDQYNFIDLFVQSGNFNKFKNKATAIFQTLEQKYPIAFKNRTAQNLLNFQYVYPLHNWFVNSGDLSKFEPMMETFIRHINFPFDLKE